MYQNLPPFRSHLELSHQYLSSFLNPGDTVIDATCGNGHDTVHLAQLVLKDDSSSCVIACDIQQQAIDHTYERLKKTLPPENLSQIHMVLACHSKLPLPPNGSPVKAIIYNLGYLPGADKSLTTKTSTTLQSIEHALELVCEGGLVHIMCYPGHEEGKKETDLIIQRIETLPRRQWNCSHHQWINRPLSPSLLLLEKLGRVTN